ncbi:MAG: RNA methyltransferase [Verrucomicrobia bacterium]|nr:RNA methyltransferase [Verrucomicrobiota bacterium]MBU1734349.1 RNA methyltransferase [Verrucomicrobiota bacterium]MBU1855702.1 RNA methyltransferase [Verrucomicrobiota bacterium]
MNTRPPPIIHSADNPVYKKLLALQTAHGIRKHGECLVAGPKLTAEAVQQQSQAIGAWISTPDLPPPPPSLTGTQWILLDKKLFRNVNVFGAPGILLTLRLPDLPVFQPTAPWPAGCTLFIPFGDPENVGGAIRAAAGLGAARVVLLREAACPFLPKAVRASAGAAWKIRLESGPDLAELTAIKTVPLFALDMDSAPLDKVKHPACYGLVAGTEGLGLPEALRRYCRRVSIPMTNGIESLNAATAIAIALWAWRGN